MKGSLFVDSLDRVARLYDFVVICLVLAIL